MSTDITASKKQKSVQSNKRYKYPLTSNVACFEPCSHIGCEHSCMHEHDGLHDRHFCSRHNLVVKPMTQQLAEPSDTLDSWRKAIHRKLHKVENINQTKSPIANLVMTWILIL